VESGRDDAERRLGDLASATERVGPELAVFLVYDRPERVRERPDLDRAYFAQRCVSNEQLDQTIRAYRDVGAYVELFAGERPFIEALGSGRLDDIDRRVKVVYNGIEGGIGSGGFQPGRKALLPALADSAGMVCAGPHAYACALSRHKYHYLTVLRAHGLATPESWHYRPGHGWAGGRVPTMGVRVIAKSTYESWSVGVHDDSVFVVDDDTERRVAAIAAEIGQPATVQEFVAGTEVCVPLYADGAVFTTPAVEAVLAKAPHDPEAVMTIEDNLTDKAVTHVPHQLGAAIDEQLRHLALTAFEILELGAFARIDFRVDAEGRCWLFDVGVSPGISRKSSAFTSAGLLGMDHATFLRAVLGASLVSAGAA
jgi:D-alanine-D-alanine ligase